MTRATANAAARLEAQRRAREREPLDAFIAGLPGLGPVPHLEPLLEALTEAERDGNARLVVSAPPGHGKSTAVCAWLAWLLRRRPTRRAIVAAYAAQLARRDSRDVRTFAAESGLAIDPTQRSAREWSTTSGGGVLAAGIGSATTGFRCDVLVIDDHTASRSAAESVIERERGRAWFGPVARTRVEPGGLIVVVATRWHEDDLSAHCEALGYRVINLPARDASGAALWPERYSLEALASLEAELGPYDFEALYMGRPRGRDAQTFSGASFYDPAALPPGLVVSIGCDLAYSLRTAADASAAVVLGLHRETGRRYVLDVVHRHARAEDFARELAVLCERHGCAARWDASGMEAAGLGPFLRGLGVRLDAQIARGDKLQRATPCAAAWNRGEVLLPTGAPWADGFLREVLAFGAGARRDDQVDALASAFNALGLGTRSGVGETAVIHPTRRPSMLGVPYSHGRRGPW